MDSRLILFIRQCHHQGCGSPPRVWEVYRRRTLCSWIFSTVRNAYGSDSLPSTFTVDPSNGCDRIRSASPDRSNSWESLSNNWRRRFFRPWKSTAGCGSNHSKSTFTISSCINTVSFVVLFLYLFGCAYIRLVFLCVPHGDIAIFDLLSLDHLVASICLLSCLVLSCLLSLV